MGTKPISDTQAMISGRTPVLLPETYIFATTCDPNSPARAEAFGTLREAEGLSLILPLAAAVAHGFDTGQPMRCITLNVYSALDGWGSRQLLPAPWQVKGLPATWLRGFIMTMLFCARRPCSRSPTGPFGAAGAG